MVVSGKSLALKLVVIKFQDLAFWASFSPLVWVDTVDLAYIAATAWDTTRTPGPCRSAGRTSPERAIGDPMHWSTILSRLVTFLMAEKRVRPGKGLAACGACCRATARPFLCHRDIIFLGYTVRSDGIQIMRNNVTSMRL